MSIHHILGHVHHVTEAMPMGNGSMPMGNGSHHNMVDMEDFSESETISAWILTILSGVLMCITVPCNLLILVAFASDSKLRTYGNYFIMNLCVADLCVGAINMPLTLLAEYMKLIGRGWPFGHLLCHLAKTLEHIFFSSSIMTVLIICNDRYNAIRNPLTHLQSRTTKKALMKIAFAWALSSLVWLSFILAWGMAEGEEALPENFCTAMYNTNHYATGVAIALAMWIPYPAILIMYCRVYSTIRTVNRQKSSAKNKTSGWRKKDTDENSSRNGLGQSEMKTEFTETVDSSSSPAGGELPVTVSTIKLVTEPNGTDHGGGERTDPTPETPVPVVGSLDQQESKEEKPKTAPKCPTETPITTLPDPPASSKNQGDNIVLRRCGKTGQDNNKATLTLTLVVASYAICWLPYGIIVPITSICSMHPGAFPPLPAYYNAAVIGFSMCQSAVNPFCYAVAQPKIRQAVYKILACYRCRSK